MTYKNILQILFLRYKEMISSKEFGSGDTSKEYIDNFIDLALSKIDIYPEDKLNRWLGYVQGVLICHGITTSTIERDFSRPLFTALYIERNIKLEG